MILLPIISDAQQVKREVMSLTDIPTGTNAAETADSDNINGILERLAIDITGTGTQSVSVVTEDGLVFYTNASYQRGCERIPASQRDDCGRGDDHGHLHEGRGRWQIDHARVRRQRHERGREGQRVLSRRSN
jgi:hypothetical protein